MATVTISSAMVKPRSPARIELGRPELARIVPALIDIARPGFI
ncbi:MAG: hypothetical protein WBP85_12230 [Terracidiphilus sp.]